VLSTQLRILNGPGGPEVGALAFLVVYRSTSWSRDSVVVTVTGMAWSLHRMGWGLDIRGNLAQLPAIAVGFSVLQNVQNVSGAHTTSFSVGT
jgi:hypothetical protein